MGERHRDSDVRAGVARRHGREQELRAPPPDPPARRARGLRDAGARPRRARRRGTRVRARQRPRTADGARAPSAGGAEGSGAESAAVGAGGGEERGVGVTRVIALLALLTLPGAPAAAQDADTAASRYDAVYDQLRNMTPRSDLVASVDDFAFRRDAIQFRLQRGDLQLLTPVGGRTVGAVFTGHGTVSLVPPLAVERAQMRALLGDSVLDAPIVAVVFIFADSTLQELQTRLTFGAGHPGPHDAGPLSDALDRLINGREHAVEPTLMAAVLNGIANGFFCAYVKREMGEDVVLEVDPQQGEPILVLRKGRLEGQKLQAVSQFPAARDLDDSVPVSNADRDPLKLDGYSIEATIGENLAFAAHATVRFTPRRDRLQWARFILFDQLDVDSVVDGSGAVDRFFRAKHSSELWVRFGVPLPAGTAHSIRVAYHGG